MGLIGLVGYSVVWSSSWLLLPVRLLYCVNIVQLSRYPNLLLVLRLFLMLVVVQYKLIEVALLVSHM